MAHANRTGRVAVVIDPWDHPFNGTVVSTRRFAASLAAGGWSLRLLTIGAEPVPAGCERWAFPELKVPGFRGLIERMRAPLARPQRRRIEAALSGCDLLHVQYPFLLGHAAIGIARRLGLPVICSFHVQPENILRNIGIDTPRLRRWLYRLFLARFYQRADHVVAPSDFAADLLRHAGLKRPLTVISNGVPDAWLKRHHARIDSERNDDRFRLLAVGRLAVEKDQALLIEAVARSRHRQRITLYLVGTGPLAQTLIDQARARQVQAVIGPCDDDALAAHYANADLVLHAGSVELEGMAVLEAMATGNAVLVAATEGSAASGLIDDGDWRFAGRDAAALGAMIDAALDAPVRRRQAGQHNRIRAASYSHDRCSERLADLYRALLPAVDGSCRQ